MRIFVVCLCNVCSLGLYVVWMPKSSMEGSVRIFVVLGGLSHVSSVSLLRTLSSFWISCLEKRTT